MFWGFCFCFYLYVCVNVCLCLLASCIRRLWRPTQTTLQTGTRTWHWPVRGCSARVTGPTVQTACWPAAPSTSDSTWRRNPPTPRHTPYARPLLTCSKRGTSSVWAGGKTPNKIQKDLHSAGTLRGHCKAPGTKCECAFSWCLKVAFSEDFAEMDWIWVMSWGLRGVPMQEKVVLKRTEHCHSAMLHLMKVYSWAETDLDFWRPWLTPIKLCVFPLNSPIWLLYHYILSIFFFSLLFCSPFLTFWLFLPQPLL